MVLAGGVSWETTTQRPNKGRPSGVRACFYKAHYKAQSRADHQKRCFWWAFLSGALLCSLGLCAQRWDEGSGFSIRGVRNKGGITTRRPSLPQRDRVFMGFARGFRAAPCRDAPAETERRRTWGWVSCGHLSWDPIGSMSSPHDPIGSMRSPHSGELIHT